MITHVSIGVRDIDRSKRFYDATLEPLGYKCLRAARSLSGYGYGRDSIALWVVQAERPVPADEKSGRTFVLPLRTPPPSTRFTRRRLPQGERPWCARSTSDLRPRLLRRLHHRSRRIPNRGILRSSRNLKLVTIIDQEI